MTARAVAWRRLVWAGGALLATQVVHGLAPASEGQEENAVGLVLGLLGVVATGVAIGAAVKRRPQAPGLLTLVSIAVGVGFVAYHGLPFDTAVTNPYWGDGTATGAQWATVVIVLLAAAVCVREARASSVGRAPAVAAG